MQNIPPEPSQRRQNASCDPCRRSKRRCLVEPHQERKTGTVCLTCRRLRYHCTFDFAESRRKRGKRTRSAADQSPTTDAFVSSDREASGFADSDFQAQFGQSNDILDSWLNFDADQFLNDNLVPFQNATESIESTLSPHGPTTIVGETQHDAASSLLPVRSEVTKGLLRRRAKSVVGCTLSSPIRLLNSSVNAVILDVHLTRIFETITGDCTSVFLDYDSNMYAGGHRYLIEDHGFHSSDTSSSTKSTPSGAVLLPSENVTRPSEDGALRSSTHGDNYTMTVSGAFLFLDHFSHLYGNRLSRAARNQSEELLREVIRVSSLQWLPESGSSLEIGSVPSDVPGGRRQKNGTSNVYADSWHRVRSLVRDAQSIRSFTVVLATIAFDMITIPQEVCGNTPELASRHEFLDTCLENLSSLDRLVTEYCANLGPSSQYGALMECCLNFARWFGYLRDTVAGLTTDRGCRLPEVPRDTQNILNYNPSMYFTDSQDNRAQLDDNIANVGRKAMTEAFHVWRQVIKVKQAKLKPENAHGAGGEAFKDIPSTLTAVAAFEQSFRTFINSCAEHFGVLSDISRKYFVYLVVFWDLGVLVLCETLRSMLNETDHSHMDMITNMRTCQWQAASSMAQMVGCVLELPAGEVFKEDSGLGADLPLILSHVSPGIVVIALEKALQQIIDWRFSSEYETVPEGIWELHVGTLLKGLVSMEVTIGGSRTAGLALQSLTREYGDILSQNMSKPVIVLTPGAWHRPEHYKYVIEDLQKLGYEAVGVTLPTVDSNPPLTSWDKDAEAVRMEILKHLDAGKDVIAIAHSYGGLVMSEGVKGLGKKAREEQGQKTGVLKLIYMCAVASQEGKTFAELTKAETEEEIAFDMQRQKAMTFQPDGNMVPKDRKLVCELLFNRCDPKDVEWAFDLMGSHPAGPLIVPLTYTAYREIPSTYIVTENDKALPPSTQERMIAQGGEGVFEVIRCQEGHSPWLSNPRFIVDCVRQAAGEEI
ncbi:hypothetical protein ANI_1_1316164 [Paecilomyces variotii No. 5]|uniref:Zn(2)-C6 fungal-type domain-containing protein n=1 Tax=Byssochlamys spectabilis (strain No. 5 / NBRC 109023) TaxID=1356009 RepID=V5FES3_BYSSN|nr:hypothetical protein ANI_1_1316164 [Paecilomyces variotii No. 5]